MTPPVKQRGFLRRALGTAPRKIALVVALCVLVPVGCVALRGSSQDCPDPSTDVAAKDLPGRYTGPGGMTLQLSGAGRKNSAGDAGDPGAAAVRVKGWPYDLFSLTDDGEISPESDGSVRRFDGSGVWEYEKSDTAAGDELPVVTLDFRRGSPDDDVPTGSQYLYVGGSPGQPVLFEQEDPDTCSNAVFRQ